MSFFVTLFTNWTSTFLVGFVTFLVTLHFFKSKRLHLLPPGPFLWPVLGNLPQILGKDLHHVLTAFAKKYGDLVWMKMGGENVLVVSSMDAATESFVRNGKVFSGRPKKRKTVDVLLGNGKDIVMADISPELKFHRNVIHSFFTAQKRDNRFHLEHVISQEAESFHCALQKLCEEGEGFDPKLEISRVVANVLCQCILGKRFDKVDNNFHEQLHVIQDIVDNIENFNVVDIFPFLENFPIPSWVRFKNSLTRRDRWLRQVIDEHKRTPHCHENYDLLGMLLNMQRQATEEDDKEKLRMLNDTTIGHIVHELFGGGIESTVVTILWFIIYLIHHQEWQELIAKEVLDQYGPDEFPTAFDRRSCPQLEAAIKETLRLACVLPVGFPHKTMTDVDFRGYKIPGDTMVILNIWAIHHDDRAWRNPYSFEPDRFLEDRNERFSYLPFGIGNRVCLGSNLAKMEVFVFCAILVSRFKFSSVHEDQLPSLIGQSGLTNRPRPFDIVLTKRH